VRIIFLDHYGVMCRAVQGITRTTTSLPTAAELAGRRSWEPFDTDCVRVLNDILAATAADIVVTSDWKHSKNLAEIGDFYAAQGVTARPIGCTTSLPIQHDTLHQQRAAEIAHWVNTYPGIDSWIAVDDLHMQLAHFAWAQDPHAAITALGLADHMIATLITR
jgi:HAD domain in Swiss Army Knife RNA repair proteins